MKCFLILSPSLVQTEIILDVVNFSFYGGSDFVHFLDHLILGQTYLYLVTPLLSFDIPSYFMGRESS